MMTTIANIFTRWFGTSCSYRGASSTRSTAFLALAYERHQELIDRMSRPTIARHDNLSVCSKVHSRTDIRAKVINARLYPHDGTVERCHIKSLT
jgi:hypothetical protein